MHLDNVMGFVVPALLMPWGVVPGRMFAFFVGRFDGEVKRAGAAVLDLV